MMQLSLVGGGYDGDDSFLLFPFALYRVAHLVADLGWVDLDIECSTVCPILPKLMGIWQKRLDKCAI